VERGRHDSVRAKHGQSAIPCAGSGRRAVPATEFGEGHAGHSRPSFLPDGRQFLFRVNGADAVSGLYLGSSDGRAPKRLAAAGRGAFLAPDRLLFVQEGALVARGFEVGSGTFTGEPVTLATSAGHFSTSATGIIAHRAASPARVRMTWFDRNGNVLGDVADGTVNAPQLSPDELRLAGDRTVGGNRDVWVADLARGGLTRFTTHAATDGFPVWSPEGSRMVFHSNRNGTFDLWTKASSGAGSDALLLETPDDEWPIHWSRDGRFLLYQRSDVGARWDLWALPMTGPDRRPIAVASTPFAERMGEFSPDGRWVVYETDESGRPEITAQAVPEASGRWPVSTRGGAAPRWSADGTEIYFIAPDGKIMAVPVTAKGSTFEAGAPAALFTTQIAGQLFRFQYAVSRDGRFLVSRVVAEASAPPIHLILNVNR
jgi:Tol biopolymer transport system component